LLDGLEWKLRNIDQARRALDILSQQIDEVGAARDELCLGSAAIWRTASDTSLARAYWKLI